MTISSGALAGIRAHAQAEPEREVCGLLMGAPGHITAVTPTANVADNPAREFEIDPAALFTAIRAERAGGLHLLGYYHSHPSGRAEPSDADRCAAAGDDKLWLIIARATVTVWRCTPGGFEPVALEEA